MQIKNLSFERDQDDPDVRKAFFSLSCSRPLQVQALREDISLHFKEEDKAPQPLDFDLSFA